MRQMRKCLHCLNMFEPKESNRTVYCSRKCGFADGLRVGSGTRAMQRAATYLRCRVCFGAFLGRGECCSSGCSMEIRRQYQLNRYNRLRRVRLPKQACSNCDRKYQPRNGNNTRFCSDVCARRARKARYGKDDRKRARYFGAAYEPINRLKVFQRDDWRCGLCGELVLQGEQAPHPRSPSIDHIVPLSRGGSHTYANVQTACWGCNTAKGNRSVGEQMLLVG